MRLTSPTLAVLALGLCPTLAVATDGMQMDGYGPISTAMGGTGAAFATGSGAMMSNPATLSRNLAPGEHMIEVAVGALNPDCNAEYMGMSAGSCADSFYMPAFGYMHRYDQLSWGVGVFAQGGMGCEYEGDSFLSAGRGETVRSEVGFGRLLVPLNWDFQNGVVLGASADVVWGSMDMQMNMTGQQFMNGFLPPNTVLGEASGPMVDGLMGMVMGGMLDPSNPINTMRVDFSNDSDFMGEATGYGLAGKIGLLYDINEQWSIGAAYHLETAISDLETDNATMAMNVNMSDGLGGFVPMELPLSGSVKVRDFQWPGVFILGTAYRPTRQWTVAADLKWLNWSSVMDTFTMTFEADGSPSNGGFANSSMDLGMYQNWDDQWVFEVGAAYDITEQWTIRGGVHLTENPIPDAYVHPLFPAITEQHYSVGAGYRFMAGRQGIDFSLTIVPEVEQTNSNTGITVSHSQVNWQLSYTARFGGAPTE